MLLSGSQCKNMDIPFPAYKDICSPLCISRSYAHKGSHQILQSRQDPFVLLTTRVEASAVGTQDRKQLRPQNLMLDNKACELGVKLARKWHPTCEQ